MCFGSNSKTPAPQPAAQVLQQDAPTKKTANQTNSSQLSIGSKRYRTQEMGLGETAMAPVRPDGPSVSK